MERNLKHFLFSYYHWIAIGAGAVLLLVAAVGSLTWKFALSALGAILSFVYFVQKQKLDEARLFKELVADFNERYDELNDDLNQLVESETETQLTEAQKHLLYDYFNLCAEEFLFYRRGYIYDEVWAAWKSGMRIYKRDSRILNLWRKERESNSYYGFDLERI
ncbi:MAG: hypothetical protein BRD40_03270 [Bacteroidetes bacterium QS_1_65_9]|nr:MAG: hypothetical protein BRD40_03270 [Bacteroidetes bacterium QS_1_65_9]